MTTIGGITIENGGVMNVSGKEVILEAGFTIEEGATVQIQ